MEPPKESPKKKPPEPPVFSLSTSAILDVLDKFGKGQVPKTDAQWRQLEVIELELLNRNIRVFNSAILSILEKWVEGVK